MQVEEIPLDGLPLSDGVIRLRVFDARDAHPVAAACEDPEIGRWTFMPDGLTVDGAPEWIRRSEEQLAARTNVRLAIERAAGHELLGQVGVGHLDWVNASGEVYYWLVAEARGRGHATRAVRLITN
jgi:RimJ/RimL family protein N-acetyltransferase